MLAGSENLTSTAPAELAGVDDLLALAKHTDGTLAAPAPGSAEALELERQAAAAPTLTLEQEFAGIFAMIGAGAGHWLPSVRGVLNDQACADLGRALAPVARKWGMARYFEGFAWRVELQALMVCVPIGAAIAGAVKHDIAELERRQREAEGRPPVAPIPQAELDRREIEERRDIEALVAAPVGMLQPIERPRAAA